MPFIGLKSFKDSVLILLPRYYKYFIDLFTQRLRFPLSSFFTSFIRFLFEQRTRKN